MSKNTKFSGKPIISQVLSFISKEDITRTAEKYKSDRYYKTFKTKDHLKTMLYTVLSGCQSLREIVGITLACEGRINHIGIDNFPKRSTLSDANKNRISSVFGDIYFTLLNKYKNFLSDSRINEKVPKHLLIIDSTTIQLFSDILKGVGRNPKNGKKKGGIKVHTMISAEHDVPTFIRFTASSVHDHKFLKELNLKPGSLMVFDKGYNDYLQFQKWTEQEIYFVTRIKDNAKYLKIRNIYFEHVVENGIIADEEIEFTKKGNPIRLRKVVYWDDKKQRTFEFLSNNFILSPDKIANIYKKRWQIELLFKRLKQNFQLKYFLGDSQNAIEIQIWSCLIAQLILKLIQKSALKKWSFSNLMSVIRFHLMTYIDLIAFLNNPNAGWERLKTKSESQLELFVPK